MKRDSWITWRIFFITIPIDAIFLIFSANHKINNWLDFYGWGGTALFAHFSLVPLVAIGVILSRQWTTWRFDLAFLILLGIFRGIVINYCVEWFSLIQNVTKTYKVFNSMIALPVWFIGVGILIESHKNYQKTYRNLFAKAIIKEGKTQKRRKLLPSDSTDSDEAIVRLQFLSANLASEIQELLNRPRSLKDYSDQANAIQHLIDDGIRPVTTKLQSASKISVPRIPFRNLIRTIVLEHRLPVLQVVLVSAPYLFVGLNGSLGLKIALYQTCFVSALNITVFLLSELAHNLRLLTRSQANFFIMVVSAVIAYIVQATYTSVNFTVNSNTVWVLVYQLLLSVTYILYLMAVNGYYIIREKRKEIIADLEKHISENLLGDSIIEGRSGQSLSDASKYLHGEIQAGLTASSLLLKQAAKMGDSGLAHEALSRASGLLNQDMTNIAFTRMAKPKVKIEKIIEAWKGIADISIKMPPLNLLEDSVLRNSVQLIEEAISNSIRHAGSTEIKVLAVLKSEVLTITIISNGNPMKKKKASLGITMFNDLADEWSYGTKEGQNILTFILTNAP